MDSEEVVNFIGTVRTSGESSLEMTIPHKTCQFLGLKHNDLVKVMIRKIEQNVKKED